MPASPATSANSATSSASSSPSTPLPVTINKAVVGAAEEILPSDLQARSPYITIEQFSLQASASGSPLTAVLRVSSVEVAKQRPTTARSDHRARPMRILVIEDEPQLAGHIVRALVRRNHTAEARH